MPNYIVQYLPQGTGKWRRGRAASDKGRWNIGIKCRESYATLDEARVALAVEIEDTINAHDDYDPTNVQHVFWRTQGLLAEPGQIIIINARPEGGDRAGQDSAEAVLHRIHQPRKRKI